MDKKNDFILAAINDTQAIIRAIDVKVAALLMGLLVPLSSLGKIWNHLVHISSITTNYFAIAIGSAFLVTWLMAVLSLVRTLSAIDNPANHIVNSNDHKGVFYGGGLFQFGWVDALFNRDVIKANKDVSVYSKGYPCDENEVASELCFEHMKLIYIRDIKLHRFKFSLNVALVWLLFGMCIYLYSKIG